MAIKKLPEDFRVTEELDRDWLGRARDPDGLFALYAVEKRQLSTQEVTSALAKQLHVAPGAVKHAGLKDKHALTFQHVTVKASDSRKRGMLAEKLHSNSWSARRVAWVTEAIPSHAIAANAFRLVVRSLTRREMQQMDDAAEQLDLADATASAESKRRRALQIVNYYGNQRFGSARHNQGFIASYLIFEQFEAALWLCLAAPHRKESRQVKRLKKAMADLWPRLTAKERRRGAARDLNLPDDLPRVPESFAAEYLVRHPSDYLGAFSRLPYLFQQLCVDSYQSWLWNRIAAGLIQQTCGPLDEQTVVHDKFCDLVFPTRQRIPQSLADMSLPILGYRSKLKPPWADVARKVLESEGITTQQLRIPGLRRPAFGEVDRRLFVTAADFHMGNPQPDELIQGARRFRRTVSFQLPRGAYATVVLRALGQ